MYHSCMTGRQRAKRVVVNLREYMPQHWETVSSCTCCINKIHYNLNVSAEIEGTIYQYRTTMFTIVDMPVST